MVLVGRVTRAHGLRGHVVIAPDTDFAEDRFVAGATVWIRRDGAVVPVTLAAVRFHGLKPVVQFDGVGDIDAAEKLVGLELRVPADALHPLPPGALYHHQIVGCRVETVAGTLVGEVTRVDGGAGGSVLVVAGPSGEVLVPFAATICVDIDAAARRIRVDPPEGLLELNAPVGRRQRRGRRAGTPGAP